MKTETEVIPRLLASTSRQKRPFSIFEIAEDIDWLSKHLGGLTEVSNRIGISTGMLNQFLRVKKLSKAAQKLVLQRKIDSVNIVHNLAKFSSEDQNEIAELVSNGTLNSIDLRLLSPLRRQHPKLSITDLVSKLKQSENKKVSVIQFPIDTLKKSIEKVKEEIINIIGSEELVEFVTNDNKGLIKITPKGEQELRKAARLNKKTLQEFTYTILQ